MFSLSLTKKRSVIWRLTLLVGLCSLMLGVSVGGISYFQASQTSKQTIKEALHSVLLTRAEKLNNLLNSIRQDLLVNAQNPSVRAAVRDFSAAWALLGDDPKEVLQQHYIHSNPFPAGRKDGLGDADDGSLYSQRHASYHPYFRALLHQRGYYDVFLVNMKGDLVYSVLKESDFATNLKTGEWQGTGLAEAFRRAASGIPAGQSAFIDFAPYGPSGDAPASFLSTKILNRAGEPLGVLIFQMPTDRINKLMASRSGLQMTGEAFILGRDFLMRSQPMHAPEEAVLSVKVRNSASVSAAEGKETIVQLENYRGIDSVVAYAPFENQDLQWILAAEISSDEAFAPIRLLRNEILIATTVLLLLVTLVASFRARRITAPMIATVEENLNQIVEQVSELAGSTMENADAMTDASQSVSDMANQVKEASQQSMVGAKTVSGATNELNSAISEISKQVVQATHITRAAVDMSEASQEDLSSLSGAVEEIGNGTKGIAEIAEQTNLLALNATIEAARAGEAGKGFAVVATEVKNLANQTAKLTDRIAQQVKAIHLGTEKVVETFGNMNKNITDIDTIAGSISAAIEEQSAVSGEIESAVGNSTVATENVVALIDSVFEETDTTLNKSIDLKSNVEQVGEAVDRLQVNLLSAVKEAVGGGGK